MEWDIWYDFFGIPQVSGSEKNIWMFPIIRVPQNGWFIMEIPIKMDDLGVPLFLETPIWMVMVFGGIPAGMKQNGTIQEEVS